MLERGIWGPSRYMGLLESATFVRDYVSAVIGDTAAQGLECTGPAAVDRSRADDTIACAIYDSRLLG